MNSSQFEQTDRAATTGMVAALAATTMFFAAVASAYIVRRGISDDWVVLSLPAPVYFSVLPGMAVSILVEAARRKASRQVLMGAVAFVIGAEMTRWRLAERAVETLLGSNPRNVLAVLNKVNFGRNKYYYSRYYGHQYKNYYAESPAA